MTFLFDRLPLYDIIHETIMPMLDYESIIQFNRCLQPADRYQARLSKDDILSHELYTVCGLMKSKLCKLYSFTGPKKTKIQKKSQHIMKLLQELDDGKRCVIMLKYYPQFHQSVVEKLNAFLDPESEELFQASTYFKKKIRALSLYLLPKIQNIVPNSRVGIPRRPLVPKGKTVFP